VSNTCCVIVAAFQENHDMPLVKEMCDVKHLNKLQEEVVIKYIIIKFFQANIFESE